jgi:hypothetical protein
LEIKIFIDTENKERILSLISQLVDAEGRPEPITELRVPTASKSPTFISSKSHRSLDSCYLRDNILVSAGRISESPLGFWAMFNSFVPGKAALRVLAHLLRDEGADNVPFARLVDETVQNIRSRAIAGLRGFPGSRKASSVPRFATHLVLPYCDMGLISSLMQDGTRVVGLTEPGLSFSLLDNPVFDDQSQKSQLSQSERKWISDYLRKIDGAGFKEYSTLRSIVDFIKEKHPTRSELVRWFSNRPDFQEQTRSGSRYSGEPSRLKKQFANLATTYVSSKVAILRELGVVSDTRGVYDLGGLL